MEVVIYLVITALWWLSTFTVLLPFVLVLLISKSVRDRWFSFFFSNVVTPMLAKILPRRKQLFDLLEDSLPNRNKSIPLEILEIGIGPGVNLQFYPENSNLTALDMNPNFFEVFQKNRRNYPQVNLKEIVLNGAEDMENIKDSAFDVVVSTLTLCSVKDVDSSMREIKRALKPGGKLLFMEHVAFPQNTMSYTAQTFAAPLWATYLGGCHINRNIASSIKNVGFSDVSLNLKYPSSLLLFVRPIIFGIATN